ncbi:MAG: SulP family inorganic anion transporter [Akkermansia muciniphila]
MLLPYFHTINWAALGLAAGTVIITLLSRRFWPRIPAMLVGMLGMTAVSVAFSLPVTTIGQPSAASEYAPLPPCPALTGAPWGADGPCFHHRAAGGDRILLSASVADGMTGGRHKPNMELIAQGIGNIGSALFGGIPATRAIARTATNIKAGAKSPVSGMIHALTLLAILMAFAHYAQQIPLAVLAGILTVVCYNMSEIHTFSRLLKGPRQDAAVLVITFLLTVFVDLVVAVEVGVVLAALLFMGRMAQISDVSAIKNELLENDEEDDGNRSAAKLDIPEGVEVFDVKGPFFFGAVEQFKDQVLETLEHDTKVVILRMRLVPALDATGLNVLSDFCHQCREHGSTLLVCGVQPQPLDVIRHAPFYRELKRYNICENIDAALNRARKIINGPAPKHL